MLKRLRKKIKKRWKELLGRNKRIPSAYKDNYR